MSVNTAIGAYRQALLEGMEDQELRCVRTFALERFNADLDRPDAGYYEDLAGAASDLLLDRLRGDP